MVASSDAANPRVPAPKSRVVSLSPTFAGRELMLWRLKSHIWELSYWESPSASSKFTLFPFRTHQPKSELKLELQPGNVRFVPVCNLYSSKPRLQRGRCWLYNAAQWHSATLYAPSFCSCCRAACKGA